MKKKRPAKSEFVHIKDILSAVIQNCRKETDSELGIIRNIWHRILPAVLSENAQPAALKGSILLVTVKSSTLTHQLRFQLNDIIETINHEIGHQRISEIKLKTGNF